MTSTESKVAPPEGEHTLGANQAFKSLVHLFPESSLRHFPDSVANIIDNAAGCREMLGALEAANHAMWNHERGEEPYREAMKLVGRVIRKYGEASHD